LFEETKEETEEALKDVRLRRSEENLKVSNNERLREISKE